MPVSVWTRTGRSSAATVEDAMAAIVGEPFVVLEVDELGDEARRLLELPTQRVPGEGGEFGAAYWLAFRGEALEVVAPVADGAGCHAVHAIASPRFVATVRDVEGVDVESLSQRVRWDIDHRAAVGAFLFVELALRSFRTAIREIRSSLDDLEESMLHAAHRDQLLRLHALQRRVNAMRRALGEYVDAVADVNDDVDTSTALAPALVQLADQHAAAVGAVVASLGELRDEAANAMELFRSLASARQSLVINRLTVISALLLPLTFVTGFFGMNFGWLAEQIESPLTFWLLGVTVPAAVAVGVLTAMWRAGWLTLLSRVASDEESP